MDALKAHFYITHLSYETEDFFVGTFKDLIFKLIFEKSLQTNS